MSNAEILSVVAILIAVSFNIYQVITSSHKDDKTIETRVARLEVQMEPLWNIIEDSVLKSVIHNPLTEIEIAALARYHARKSDVSVEDLLVGKAGLQRELKELEDDPRKAVESTLPYVMTIAAIDRRLGLLGYDNGNT